MLHPAAIVSVAALACSATGVQQVAPLRLARTIPMPEVEGRIDHLAVDAAQRRAYVAALGNGTLEVLDLDSGKRLKTVGGLNEPQGVLTLADPARIAVTTGDGGWRLIDAATFAVAGTVDLGDDADNLRLDRQKQHVWVGCGDGVLVEVDPAANKRLGEIRLPGHPESFQLASSGPRIFVNVPKVRAVVVADRDTRSVVATWRLEDAGENFPMALDEAHHRLLVVCRSPAKLVVLDTETGKRAASVDCVGDADDIFLDAKAGRVYISGGEGFVDVLAVRDADRYERVARVPTAAGARTSLLVPDLGLLLVAVPHRGEQKAELRSYAIGSE